MRSRWLAAAFTVATLAALPPMAASANPGGPLPSAPTVAVAHTGSVIAVPKFIFHAGLAFGAFHHFIYLPFIEGKFTHGGLFSKAKTYVEAGLAALFVYHEVKLALADAQQNKVLKVLVSPLTAAIGLFATIVSKVKGHSLDQSSVSSAAGSVSSIEAAAKQSGSTIAEAIPSAAQLAAGFAS